MKFCKRCNRFFNENQNFCPNCGERLDSTTQYDIFGDPMDDQERKSNYNPLKDDVVVDTVENDGGSTQNKSVFDKVSEIFSLLSIVLWMLPFYGTMISIASLILNIVNKKKNNKKPVWMILSIISIVLSIIWVVVLFTSGVFKDMYGELFKEFEEYYKEVSNI